MSDITLEQKIAQKEQEIARLKEQARKKENGQKIVIGGMVMSLAKNNSQRARQLLTDINNNITRKTDLNRLDDLINELTKKVHELNNH